MEAMSESRTGPSRAKTVLIVSLNFNPGHFSHLAACYRLCEELGARPLMYVDAGFDAMDPEGRFRKVHGRDEIAALGGAEAAVFWFPSLRNYPDSAWLKRKYRTRILYVFHEPYDSFGSYRRAGFSLAQTIRIGLIALAMLPAIRIADSVALPSKTTLALYEKRYARLNGAFDYLPLLFDDESGNSPPGAAEKNCFSYIGTVAKDHAFDKYVAFVKACVEGRWLPGLSFRVATKSVVPERERAVLDSLRDSGRVSVVEGRPMTNEEINRHFSDSVVVWNAYDRSNQSGVLPKAYMFGAAVIVLSRNASEFIENHRTGVLVEDNGDADQIRKAVEEILARREGFLADCRGKFMETFYYRSCLLRFAALMGGPGA
jgi:hypothetical protein